MQNKHNTEIIRHEIIFKNFTSVWQSTKNIVVVPSLPE